MTYEVKHGYALNDTDTIVCDHVELMPNRALVFYADAEHKIIVIAYNSDKWNKITRTA